MAQKIIFTTLPHYRSKDGNEEYLHLSVAVSIRLETTSDSKLSQFPDMLNWPSLLKEKSFGFSFSGGKVVDATPENKHLRPELWSDLFHDNIRVKGFEQEDLSIKRIHSYPVKHVNDFVLKQFQRIAVVSPKRMLKPSAIIDPASFGQVSRFQLDNKKMETLNQIQIEKINDTTYQAKGPRIQPKELIKKDVQGLSRISDQIRQNKFVPFKQMAQPEDDFLQLRDFHKVEKKEVVRPALKIEKPTFEFHDMLAVITNHSIIQRYLGLILDFVIPLPQGIKKNGTVHFIPKNIVFTTSNTTVSAPPTAYQLSPEGFYTNAENNSVFSQGFVKINSDRFTVFQHDSDGAGIKTNMMAENKVKELADFQVRKTDRLLNHSFTLQQLELEEDDDEEPTEEGLPSMRTVGIAIARNGMAEHLHQRFVKGKQLETQLLNPSDLKADLGAIIAQKPLYADDLVQGYRMDIAYAQEPDKWYSLHQRKQSYAWFDENGNEHDIPNELNDEGFIELALAEDPDDPEDVFVPETLARWEGWSLSVPRPGYAINEADEEHTDPKFHKDYLVKNKSFEAKKYAFDPELEFRMNTQVKIVPGTLPKLRFGTDYFIRVRTVDLAGNSIPISHAGTNESHTVLKNIRYLRYEPLSSPIVLSGTQYKDGESLEKMVIRSNYNQSSSEFESQYAEEDESLADHSLRYFLPPQNSQQIAETHGMFEQAFTNNPEATREIYHLITSLEASYERSGEVQDKIYKAEEAKIIYLPDPMAAGVALFLAPGFEKTHSQEFSPRLLSFFSDDELTPNDTDSVTIPDDWYKAKHIQIQLAEGEMGAHWNRSKRTIIVSVPKGRRLMLKFSTFWRSEDLKQVSALWDLIKKEGNGNLSELEQIASSGQHWMISPARELELTHAVLQPMLAPNFKALRPERDFDDTFALLNAKFPVDGPSTLKVDIHAQWTEPVDDGLSVAIKEKKGQGNVPDIFINYTTKNMVRGDFSDEPLAPKLQVAPASVKRTGITKTTTLPRQVMVSKRNLFRKANYFKALKISELPRMALKSLPFVHQFNDTKHRWVNYSLVAFSRYRSHFDGLLAKETLNLSTQRQGEWVKQVNILSTVRPQSPEVAYIVPTFDWRYSETDSVIHHTRKGGGLRVFIKRPWFSSGDDERLAIILPDYPKKNLSVTALTTPKYTPYFTHWGFDPIRISQPPQSISPKANQFKYNPLIEAGLSYPDQPDLKALAVSYPVKFDNDRQMWYCDLGIDQHSMYFPFIKLALARYQPHSVKQDGHDVCLSPINMAQMIQLVPERKATVSFMNPQKRDQFLLEMEGDIHQDLRNTFGVYNYIEISFLDTELAQPITGVIDNHQSDNPLTKETITIPIDRQVIKGTRFSFEKKVHLPGRYKNKSFQMIIEEYETAPVKMDIDKEYHEILANHEDRKRLVYADVFKLNER
jgi:hypothetical protein